MEKSNKKSKEKTALSHLSKDGKINMVDVSGKPLSSRIARASGWISLNRESLSLVRENGIKKGSVLTTAQIAGIMAAKRTWDVIPLCHSLILNKVDVTLTIENNGIKAESYISCTGNTGVEMEALHAVSVALLTVYDMCKAVDKKMVISEIKLDEKTKEVI
ncbi:MAG: cyclic pyranopterin monophosphate synthase MoaC [Bacteroidetes bacterium HGW-Bacteroidetes-7]|jgi:cyclic pyranopterin phosphate synthase|nr:MAG: cyclic pyranopterin monophosphate synthase MoaC [Bacteroidetes bacterium HGW-Bacteroidetes-7]